MSPRVHLGSDTHKVADVCVSTRTQSQDACPLASSMGVTLEELQALICFNLGTDQGHRAMCPHDYQWLGPTGSQTLVHIHLDLGLHFRDTCPPHVHNGSGLRGSWTLVCIHQGMGPGSQGHVSTRVHHGSAIGHTRTCVCIHQDTCQSSGD